MEVESTRLAGHLLRLVAQMKNDRHKERDGNNALEADFEDTLRSLSIEDSISLGNKTLLSVGIAHHELHPDKVVKPCFAYSLPGKQTATDPQIGLFYDLSPTVRLYATIAEKTRLPTLKDRYSAHFDRYIENPDLKPEQARNYEVGHQGQPWAGAQAEAAMFWSEVKDQIQSVLLFGSSCGNPGNNCQMQHVGKTRIKGIELGLKTPLGSQWEIGGNATFMDLENRSDPSVKLTGIPETKIILHSLWRLVASVDLIAFAEHDGGHWASNTVRLDGFTTLNLKAVRRPMKYMATEVRMNNVTDKNYELDRGFPADGRMWSANLNYIL